MHLIDLLSGDKVDVAGLTELGQTEITGLTCDSRRVKPGFLFAAFPGEHSDGREFIPEAVGRGASAVLAPPGTRLHPPTQATRLLTVDNPRRIFSLMAARFYELQPRTVAAVTGTNGKTSVVTFLRQIWTQLGRRAASMGTLGVTAPDLERSGNLTTPDSVELHRQLRELSDAGVDRLAMEASSHGLSQYRLDGVHIAAAAFTNLSRDHLDYHGSMEAYGAAKLRLVIDLTAADGAVVVNADDPMSEAFSVAARGRGLRVITFGRQGQNIRLLNAEPSAVGQTLHLECFGTTTTVELPLVGSFQASNVLCAFGLAVACGEKPKRAAETLGSLKGVRGRMELCARLANGATVFVDYAHTPDALGAVLQAFRPHTKGKLVVVFGCGGDRDTGKRPQMGEIADNLADRAFVTDDNPRSEDAGNIRQQILAACPHGKEIGDRAEAIKSAVAGLSSGDILVVAGKGHESGQIVGTEILPFDDADVVRRAVAEVSS